MSQEAVNEKSINEQKKKTRRTRKDQDGRDFQCPCGKSYLSYPALYTHIKTKHQGKIPREDGVVLSKVELEEDGDHKDPLQSIKQNIQRYFPGDNPDNYPTPLGYEQKEIILNFIDIYQSSKQTILQQLSNRTINATIQQIFGHFLAQVKAKILSEAYLYCCQFISYLYEGILVEKNDPRYCKDNNGTNLPQIFNDLVLNSRLQPTRQNSKGSPMANTTLTCKMLYYFGVWVFEQRYTNLLVKLSA